MKEFNLINLNQYSWQLNVAIMGGVFAVFSLIYNDYYIYYGLLTFAYGLSAHISLLVNEWLHFNKNLPYFPVHLFNVILSIIWLIVLIKVY